MSIASIFVLSITISWLANGIELPNVGGGGVGGQMNVPHSIAIQKIKSCELDPLCFGCWQKVELSIHNQNKNECKITAAFNYPASSNQNTTDIETKFCCQLWKTFDCRTAEASSLCNLREYIGFRRNLVNWSNLLLRNNICSETFFTENLICEDRQENLIDFI